MSLAVHRSTGAKAASTTTAVSVPNGTGFATGDLDLLIGEVPGTATLSITVNGGSAWTAMTGSPITVTGGEKLYVWWRIAQSGDSAPSVQASADHVCACRIHYQTGTFDTSDPFEIETTGTEATSDTSFSWDPGTSTTDQDRICVVISSIKQDLNSGGVPVCTNSNLTGLVNRANICTNSGAGGGFGYTEGARLQPGAVGTFACTYSTASPKSYISFAIKPFTIARNPGTIADSLGITDSVIVSIGRSVTQDDALAITDAQSFVRGVTIAVDDPIAVTDQVSFQGVFQRSISDALGITDSATPAPGKEIFVNDALGITDVLTFDRGLTIADALAITDATIQAIGYGRTIADPLGITDALSIAIGRGLVQADALSITDAQSFARALLIADALGITDTAIPQGSGSQALTINDALGITDQVVSALSTERSIADNIGVTDSLTSLMQRAVIIADDLAILDTLTFGRALLLEDLLALTDQVVPAPTTPGQLLIQDNLTITDNLEYLLYVRRLLVRTKELVQLLSVSRKAQQLRTRHSVEGLEAEDATRDLTTTEDVEGT